MTHRLAAAWVAGAFGVAVVAVGAVVLWPASEEEARIEALASTDPDEVRRAADLLAASGASASGAGPSVAAPSGVEPSRSESKFAAEEFTSTNPDDVRQAADRLAASGGGAARVGSNEALEALRETRDRLVAQLIEDGNRDLKQFGHLDFDLMVRRISDRRQSSQAQRLWLALGSVTRAIAVLDPESPEAWTPEPADWEVTTQEEWDRRAEEWEAQADQATGGGAEGVPPVEPAEAIDGAPGLEEEMPLDMPRPEESEEDRVRNAVDLPATDSQEADSAR